MDASPTNRTDTPVNKRNERSTIHHSIHSQGKQYNVAILWIDNKNANDMASLSWIIKFSQNVQYIIINICNSDDATDSYLV